MSVLTENHLDFLEGQRSGISDRVPVGQQAFDQAVQIVQRQRRQFVVRQGAQEQRVRAVTIELSQRAGDRAEVLFRILALDQDDFLEFIERFRGRGGTGQQFDQQRPRRWKVFVQPRDADRGLVIRRADGKIGPELVPFLFQLLAREPLRA